MGGKPTLVDVATNPNLQFDTFVLPEDGLDFEVDADRTDKRRREWVISIAEQERRFADAAVADNQQLEHVVEALVGGISAILAVGHCRWWHGPTAFVATIYLPSSLQMYNSVRAAKATKLLNRQTDKQYNW